MTNIGAFSEYCGTIVNIWQNLDKLSRCVSKKTGMGFQNESHVKFNFSDLLHILLTELMLQLVFCIFPSLCNSKPVNMTIVRYMFIT